MKRIIANLLGTLRRQCPAIASPLPGRTALLVIDYRYPTPDQDAGSVRMTAMLDALLHLGWRITFIADDPGAPDPYRQALEAKGIQTLTGKDAAIEHLEQHGPSYHAVIASRPHAAVRYLIAIKTFMLDARLIYDTVDLHWVRRLRQADVEQNPALRILAHHDFHMESLMIQHADGVLAVTEEERSTILGIWPSTVVHLLHNIHTSTPLPATFAQRSGLMFIGGFEHAPNGDAMRWFARDVLPIIRASLPHIQLNIVGSKPTPDIQSLQSDGITVAGFVPDVEPCFNNARIFIAPLRSGAGMKGKIGQAMAYGLPVVTTSIGAEGLLLEHEQTALVADTPETFAEQVVRLYQDADLWTRLRENALHHVEEHFSPKHAEQALKNILSGKGGPPCIVHSSKS